MLRFHKLVAEAHERMRELIPRIYKFVDDLDSGADPNKLVQNLLTHFESDFPNLFALGIMHNDRLVGHLVIQFENYYGCTNMTVIQYQLDEPPPRSFHQQAFEELLTIGDLVNARNLVAVCPDERVERLHKIFHGMKRYATLMTLDLDAVRAEREKTEEAANG